MGREKLGPINRKVDQTQANCTLESREKKKANDGKEKKGPTGGQRYKLRAREKNGSKKLLRGQTRAQRSTERKAGESTRGGRERIRRQWGSKPATTSGILDRRGGPGVSRSRRKSSTGTCRKKKRETGLNNLAGRKN